MQAQTQTKPVYTFPTKEEERAQKREREQRYAHNLRRRTVWEDYRERQAVWQAALGWVNDPNNAEKVKNFQQFLADKRGSVRPSYVHSVTYDVVYQVEEGATLDTVNAGMLEEGVGLEGVVVGSRNQRSQFWDFVELVTREMTPSDLAVPLDVEQQYAWETQEVEAWGRRHQVENPFDRSTWGELPAEVTREVVEIYTGHHRGIRFYTGDAPVLVRRFANLYMRARHSLREVTDVELSRAGSAAYLKVPQPEDTPGAKGETLAYWQCYGIRSFADVPAFGFASKLRQLPSGVLSLGEGWELDQMAQMQLLGAAVTYFGRWPASQLEKIALMYERLYVGRARMRDSKRYRNPLPGQPPARVEQAELELFGRAITQGDPYRRERFWEILYGLSKGIPAEKIGTGRSTQHFDSPQSRNSETVRTQAAQYVAEGYNPFWVCKPVMFGRGGLSVPLDPTDPQVQADHSGEYVQLRFYVAYGMAAMLI